MLKSLMNPFDPAPCNRNDMITIIIRRNTKPNLKKQSFCTRWSSVSNFRQLKKTSM